MKKSINQIGFRIVKSNLVFVSFFGYINFFAESYLYSYKTNYMLIQYNSMYGKRTFNDD